MATPNPIDLNYRVDGPPGAPVLVLSHALGLSLAMWDPQVESLSRTFRVLRYDHRGHGGSPVPAGPYSIAELGRDLFHLLDRLGLERVSFCGLSLGGMVGMWVASTAPERIDRLVLCCTATRMARPEDFAARARTVREQGMEAIADSLIGRWFTPAFPASDPRAVAGVRAMLLSIPREGYAGACEAIAQMDLRGELPRINAPTLVIGAEQDQSTPPEESQEIARGIPGARLVVIPDAAHLANIEQPDAVTNKIVDHLLEVRHESR
ncbi:MAG: 3-oxoadipate enol-lactonase [Candidatus Dormibacteraeota bacterium]|nr:3-oxoadipate enol-lactonase [Candidatus Dormibacteraeota bacterium]